MNRHTFSLLMFGFSLAVSVGATACGARDNAAAERDALAAELESATTEMNALKTLLASSGADLETLEAKLVLLEGKLTELSEQLSSNIELESLRTELAAIRTELDEKLGGTLVLSLPFQFGNDALVLGTEYTLTSGTKVRFTQARYWLSNVVLKGASGTPDYTVPNAYFLMEASSDQKLDGTKANITINGRRRETVSLTRIPAGNYTAVTFSIGVDAARNDNPSLGGGELTLAQNMSEAEWMWFTSYIFASTKGTFSTGDDTWTAFNWETGTNECLRTQTFTFPKTAKLETKKTTSAFFTLDLAKLFVRQSPSESDRALIHGTRPADATLRATLRGNLADDFVSAIQLGGVEGSAP